MKKIALGFFIRGNRSNFALRKNPPSKEAQKQDHLWFVTDPFHLRYKSVSNPFPISEISAPR